MNRGPYIFLGAFTAFAAGWAGLVLAPQLQVGWQEPVARSAMAQAYPTARPGQAEQGREVYRSLGCAECHTQQVRPTPETSDIVRGWGKRRTVAQDFLYDQPVLLGHLRVGPDLANLGTRTPGQYAAPWHFQTASNHVQELTSWQLQHLYAPRELARSTVMPAYRFLFEERELKPGQTGTPNALQIISTRRPHGETVRKEIVPRPEVLELVAYLMSLNASAPLYEAPIPARPAKLADTANTNSLSVGGATNSPAAATNPPAK